MVIYNIYTDDLNNYTMFCEDPEEIQMVSYLCGIYPEGEEMVIDLMVWCWRHKNKEFLSLLEKHKGFEGLEEQMVRFSEIDYAVLRKVEATPTPCGTPDATPTFDATGSFTTENDDCGSKCDSCGS